MGMEEIWSKTHQRLSISKVGFHELFIKRSQKKIKKNKDFSFNLLGLNLSFFSLLGFVTTGDTIGVAAQKGVWPENKWRGTDPTRECS